MLIQIDQEKKREDSNSKIQKGRVAIITDSTEKKIKRNMNNCMPTN